MKRFILISGLWLAAPAFANVGIPVVAFGWPFMLVNLLFVILIEVFVLKKIFPALSLKGVVTQVAVANLITTVIGYPLVAVVEGLSPLLQMNLGWILPFANVERMYGYLGLSMLLTLIPCYFLSVWVEGKWLRSRLKAPIGWKPLYVIHLFSYAFLIAQIWGFPVPMLTYGALTYEWAYKAVMSLVMLFQ